MSPVSNLVINVISVPEKSKKPTEFLVLMDACGIKTTKNVEL